MNEPTNRNLPPEGWEHGRDANTLRFTMHGSSWGVTPPKRKGWHANFIARHGVEYTTWTYRKVTVL